MNSDRQRPAAPGPLIVLFVIISAGALLAGILYSRSLRNQLLTTSQQELSTIADLKIRQITQWRRERIADGIYLSESSSLSRQVSAYLKQKNNRILRNDLLNDLKSLTDNYDYRNALLFDKDRNVILFSADQDTVTGDYLGSLLPQVISKGEVVLTDLHLTGKVSFVHLDLLVPVREKQDSGSAVIGLLVLRIDPQEILYPLINLWPVASKTAETIIFRREGDSIAYLNELRHVDNKQLFIKVTADRENLPAALALQGIRRTTSGLDYRGVPVIAAMNKIPESPWYMVAKIDRDEIVSRLPGQIRMIFIVVILFILAVGLSLGFLWRSQRVRYYESELHRLALVRHYDYILKNANDIIFLFDRNYNIVEANDKAIETYQYERDELIGHSVRMLRTPETAKRLEEDLKELNTRGYSIFETVHSRKDGTTFPIEISARKFDIENGMYYQSISRDISERKMAEETLRESEEKFRRLFEESHIGMVMTAKDMTIIKGNAAFCKMMGYTEEELQGMTFRNFTHPDQIGADEVSLLLLVARKIPLYHTEKRYVRKDGSTIWGSTSVILIRNNNGEVQHFFALVEDITSRKKAEAELENSFSLLKATLESTADGILVVDNNGKIVQYNRKFAEMWNIPEHILESRDDRAALDFVLNQLKYPEEFLAKVRYLYTNKEDTTSDDLLEFKDGRFFDRYSQPQKLGGKTVGRVWSFRDITARKKAETELIAAKEKAEESDRLKTAFLHNVSHEIRTPMNAILGFSALLNEPDITEQERHQFTDVISQSGNQLLSIINDIVDLASIESGQMKVTLSQLNINTTLRRIAEQFSYREKSQKITLSLHTPLHQKEAEIFTDKTKLVQILSNLINNAFKFTNHGKISIGYSRGNGNIEFYVRDTGIGIPEEHQAKVFGRFYQVDSAVSRQYGGAGLGLSICKAYVELLGGTIWLESKPEEGTTFFFTIPYRKII